MTGSIPENRRVLTARTEAVSTSLGILSPRVSERLNRWAQGYDRPPQISGIYQEPPHPLYNGGHSRIAGILGMPVMRSALCIMSKLEEFPSIFDIHQSQSGQGIKHSTDALSETLATTD